MQTVTLNTAATHETPNAVMRTLSARSTGGSELAVWETRMRAGQQGPPHAAEAEQVWTVVSGELEIDADGVTALLAAGDSVRLDGSETRQVSAITDVRVLVTSPVDPMVTTSDGERLALPWGA